MAKQKLRPTTLALEVLETRDAPSATPLVIESFDQTPRGWLPTGWAQWSNTGTASFGVSNTQAVSGVNGIASDGTTTVAARTWFTTPQPADVQVSAAVYLNSLVPLEVVARGSNLANATPTLYALSVTRGLQVQLQRVVNGVATTLGTLSSASYLSGQWVRITLAVNGTGVRGQVVRLDTGQYLNSSGQWQSAPAWALDRTDTAISGGGLVGLARPAAYPGAVSVDDFTAIAPESKSPGFLQTFNQTSVGFLPTGWSQWSSGPSSSFAVSGARPLSGLTGLAGTAGANVMDLAWLNTSMTANVDVSAALFVNSTIPAQVFARGSNLNGKTPSYYAVSLTQGLQVQLVRVQNGVTTVLGSLSSASSFTSQWVRVTLYVNGGSLHVQVVRLDTKQFLNSSGQWQTAKAWALDRTDGSITGGGSVGLAKPAAQAGTVYFDDFLAVDITSAPATPTGPVIPQHYSWIRIAQLAYSGLTLGTFEEQLLKSSVDLVIPSIQYLNDIQSVSPNTPQLIYTNTSSIYENLLTAWLNYAQQNGISPESAFYHVSQPTPFSGASASSQPVNWFWGVYRGGLTPTWTDLTSAAHSTSGNNVTFGAAGESLYLGYTDKFAQININLASAAKSGWSAVLEYPTAVDAFGNPTAWSTLTTVANTTAALTRSGQMRFNPPSNWVPALIGGSARLYYVRFRTVTGGTAPVAVTILGEDYVNANGGASGVIPVFDSAADLNHDGYLNDAEYAKRASGKNARFFYQSRLFAPNYGQMRFATNPSAAAFRNFEVAFHSQLLSGTPIADGLFMDNSAGNPPASPGQVVESISTYTQDYAAMLKQIGAKIAPHWILPNVDPTTASDAAVAATSAYFQEFAVRPLAHNYLQFEDLAAIMAHRATLTNPAPYAVLDSLPAGGSATDARTQIATLAYYYMVADPKTTFLMFNGGASPSSSWTQHWSAAVTYNVGQPTDKWSVFATGIDPANSSLNYRVYQRHYANALVLYKPLSGNSSGAAGGLGSTTATTFALGGTYRPLQANGTLGTASKWITLRNGEGAILVKA